MTPKPSSTVQAEAKTVFASPRAWANQSQRQTVLVDIGPAVHQGAGLSRYAHALVHHLGQLEPKPFEIACFYNRHSGHLPPHDLQSYPAVSLPLGQYVWRLSALAGQILRLGLPPILPTARRVLRQRPALYHATEHLLPRVGVPTVLTVHDLIFESLPQFHTRLNRGFLRLAMPRFLRAATAILAVSRHTAHDIVARYHIDTAKIHVVHEGVDDRFRPADAVAVARVQAQYARNRPYLLMVGTLEPRKNHALALRALRKLHDAGRAIQLVIAGGKGWLFDSVQQLVEELGLVDSVIFTGYVSAEDLPPLYTGAECFLLPSLYEGFGFPVLEAMACNTPVICSNVSSLPEIAGDAARYVDTDSVEQLAHEITRVLDEPTLAHTLRKRGLARAAQFGWPDCAARTAEVYQEAIEFYHWV